METMDEFILRRKHRILTRYQRTNLTFFSFLAPWFFGLVFLTIIPLLISLVISFTNYDGLNWDSMKFIQFRNYTRAFEDPDVSHSLHQTLIWLVLYLPLWMTIPFILALLLNQIRKGRGFYRVLYYIPSLIPASAAMMAWRSLLDKNFGMLNALIGVFRPGTAIGWMSNYSLQVLTGIVIWSSLGTGMIIFLAGLQDIPDELLDAAMIDGANSWDIFWKVVLPLMTPIIFFQLVVGLINVFQQLSYVLLMVFSGGMGSAGIPPREIYFYIFNAYHQIIANQRQGYGAALLWLLFIGIVILSLVIFWSQKYWVHTRASAE